MSRDSELAALAGKYPRWEAWRGISGLFYARQRGTDSQPVSGEDVTDLADSIEREQRLEAAGLATPTSDLARIRQAHPEWSIRHVTAGFGWTAHRGGERIWSGTLPDLERQLAAADMPSPDGLPEKG